MTIRPDLFQWLLPFWHIYAILAPFKHYILYTSYFKYKNMGATPTTTPTTLTAMLLVRYIAFKDSEYEYGAHQVMKALDACNIKYDWYGHDEVWSVLRIHGVASTGTHDSSYEGALEYKGVHWE